MQEHNEAEQWRQKGNSSYSAGDFEQAISHYTKAIELNPKVSTYYSNRSRCYLKLKNWEKTIEDAQRSIEEDMSNIKGHILLGSALCEQAKKEPRKIEPAINRLKKALSLCSSQNLRQYEAPITEALFRAKKLRWLLAKATYESESAEAEAALSAKIEADREISAEEKAALKSDLERLFHRKFAGSKTIPAAYLCPLTGVTLSETYARASPSNLRQHLRESSHRKPPPNQQARPDFTGNSEKRGRCSELEPPKRDREFSGRESLGLRVLGRRHHRKHSIQCLKDILKSAHLSLKNSKLSG